MPTLMQKIRLAFRGWNRRREEAQRAFVAQGTQWAPPAAPGPSPSTSLRVGMTSSYFIYIGALQQWQGIETLFRAFARLRDLPVGLVVCSSHDTRYAKAYVRLAEKLEIADRLVWQCALDLAELQPWLQHAVASVAPLSDSS